MFEATLEDRDLPLPTPMLEPVQKKLKESISEVLKNISFNKSINERLPDILKNWRNKCLADPKIDVMIKAPIIKGMLNDNSMENSEQKNYLNTDTVADIHKKLQQEQQLRNQYTKTINRGTFRKDTNLSSIMKEQFPKTQKILAKAVIEGKLFHEHLTKNESSTNHLDKVLQKKNAAQNKGITKIVNL